MPPSPGWRVKLYQLNNDGQWDDHGTGKVSCRHSSNDSGAYLIVMSEDTENGPVQQLFHGKVAVHNNIYQRQRDTIITWQQPDTMVDLALSFQDVEGCQDIWDALQKCQLPCNIENDSGGLEGASQATNASEVVKKHSLNARGQQGDFSQLPAIAEENLDSIANVIESCMSQPHARHSLVQYLLEGNGAYVEGSNF